MRKPKPEQARCGLPNQNPVAKYAARFNKSAVFSDGRRYQRHGKHRGQESFTMISREISVKGFGIPAAA